jgi:hypothetical protein
MNTDLNTAQVSPRFVIESSDHSVSNHLTSSRQDSGVFSARLTGPRAVVALFQGPCVTWASPLASRLATNVKPNRVHVSYGLIVHLQLLSTPPRGDAVTFGYSLPEQTDKDFHLAGSMQLRAH